MPNETGKTIENVSVAVTPAQFRALRKLSLKYDNLSVEAYAKRLFAQVVRNYYKTDMKAIATKAGEDWDKATKLGFAPPQNRADYVAASVKTSIEIWRELNGASDAIVE